MGRILSLIAGMVLVTMTATPYSALAHDTGPYSAQLFRLYLPKGVELGLPFAAPSAEAQENFKRLTPELQLSFLNKRKKFLDLVAKSMAGPRLTGAVISGAASVSADGLRAILPPKHWFLPVLRPVHRLGKKIINWFIPPAEYLANPDPEVTAELAEAEVLDLPAVLPEPEPDVLPAGGLSARGIEVIRSTVLLLDQHLWSDCERLAKTTHYSVTLILGPSVGAAIKKMGFYRMAGLEMELGFEFKTGKFYSEIHPVTQKLTHSIGVFESHFIMGALVKFTQRENGKLVGNGVDRALQFPPVFSYRSSDAMLGFGAYFGLNILDTGCLYLIVAGDPYIGGPLWLALKLMSSLSVFWTDYTVYQKISWPSFKKGPLPKQLVQAAEQTTEALAEPHRQLEHLAGTDTGLAKACDQLLTKQTESIFQ